MDNQQPEQTVHTEEGSITIDIPADSPGLTNSQTPQQSTNNQEPAKIETPIIETITSPPVQVAPPKIEKIKCETNHCNKEFATIEEFEKHVKEIHIGGGRPCKYCQNKEYYQKIVDDYLKIHQEAIKPTIPWIEELALKLGVDDYTFTLWAKKEKNGEKIEDGEIELEHPELSSAYSILKSLQKLRLKQRALGRFNPHGALYLLNADHKVIQTNKTEIGNTDKEPLIIQVVEEKKNE